MSTVATLPTSSDAAKWTDEEKAAVEAAGLVFKHTYGAREGQVEPAPRAVVVKFMHAAQRTGLDPLARQIYCIPRLAGGTVEWSIQTAIDGFRVIAERSNKYAGQSAAEWLTSAGEWVPAFVKSIHGDHPLAARVAVYRSDWGDNRPSIGIATWDEYAQTKRNGDLTAMWLQRGPGQLAKCAEALALRKAFPQDLSGMFTDDEMAKQETQPVEVEHDGTDWAALIDGCETLEELARVTLAIKESGAGNDELRTKRAARLGILHSREEETVVAEVVNDDGDSTERVSGASGSGETSEPGNTAADRTMDQGSEQPA